MKMSHFTCKKGIYNPWSDPDTRIFGSYAEAARFLLRMGWRASFEIRSMP